MIRTNLLTKEAALEISKKLRDLQVKPSEDRIMLSVPKEDGVTSGGIIIPGKSDELPKTGVVVRFGPSNEDNLLYNIINIGDIVTYGLYAGKEVEPIGIELSSQKLVILSLTEIVMIQKQ